jgi:hypothetical protein
LESDDWVPIQTAIVAVLAEEGRRLQKWDESLKFGANGRLMRYGDVASWLTVSRFGEVVPLIETTVAVAGTPGCYQIRAAIGTPDGEVLAELVASGGGTRTVDEMVSRLRQFLGDNAELLQRMATPSLSDWIRVAYGRTREEVTLQFETVNNDDDVRRCGPIRGSKYPMETAVHPGSGFSKGHFGVR